MTEDAQGRLRDIDGLIPDAFEIAIDAGSGKYEAQVDGHRSLEGDELHHTLVDFDLHLVDGVFVIDDALGQGFVLLKYSLDRLVDSELGETRHTEQALLQLLQIMFKVPFHSSSSGDLAC